MEGSHVEVLVKKPSLERLVPRAKLFNSAQMESTVLITRDLLEFLQRIEGHLSK